MAGYAPIETTDNADYALTDARIFRSDSRQLESPSDVESHRQSRGLPSRSDTANSNPSLHDSLLENNLRRESRRWSDNGSTIFGVDTKSIRHSIAPQWHDEKNPLDTARPFIHSRQAWRLSRLAISEFILTLILCISLYLVLKYYEKRATLPLRARQEFNTFITILALLLGINLAASLRSYAKLLRWRLLSYTYRPLRTFDLVLGCDSLMNVTKLLFTARNEAYPYLPSWTQVTSAFWLLMNLAMTLAVGLLGLNFNLEPVNYSDITSPGPALIPNLTAVLSSHYWHSLSTLQARGAGSFGLYADYLQTLSHSLDYGFGRFGSSQNGTTIFWLPSMMPDFTASSVSRVFIRNDVVCTQYPVVGGELGLNYWFVYTNSTQKPVNVTVPGYRVGEGGVLAMSNLNSTCGNRCTEVALFVAGANKSEPGWGYYDAAFYKCTSTISSIGESLNNMTTVTHPSNIQLPDTVSRMLAGSVGWSDSPYLTNDTWMYQTYHVNSGAWFRPNPQANWGGLNPRPTVLQQVQDYIASFNMAAIVSASSVLGGSVGFQQVHLDAAPAAGLTLVVYWRWTYMLLFGMPAGQLIVLIIVLLLANNTIIRDDSHLAISKIYFNLLKKYDLGEKGCMLHAEELVQLMDCKVAYTWRDLPDHERNGRPVGHVDVFEQPQYRFKITGGNNKKLSTRPEKTTWPQDKYYD